jgi:diguanylate cyclase (GGDEF)-like protein/PAS domain S-box-containing protein
MGDTTDIEAEYESLLGFLYICPVGVLRVTATGEVEMINPYAAQMLVPLARTPVLRNLFDVLDAYAPELRGMVDHFTAPSGSICQNHRITVSRSGPGARVIACTLLKINPDVLMGVLQDITDMVEQERQLRQNEAMFAALVVGVKDFALFSLDRNGLIDSWNMSGRQQTGYPVEEVIGRDLQVLAEPESESADSVANQIEEAIREGWSLRECWCLRRDGSRYWSQVMVASNQVTDVAADGSDGSTTTDPRDITGFAVVLRDITERHVSGEELRRLLTTDHLTGATNRARFFDLAEIEIARHQANRRPLSAVMLDVDYFKQVNDRYGHAAGDALLQRMVTLCRVELRSRDVLARMGGEEFAILLPNATLDQAVAIAERIRASLEAAFTEGSPTFDDSAPVPITGITVSLGCAELNPSVMGVDALLHAADTALYDAKRGGRNQVQVAPPG